VRRGGEGQSRSWGGERYPALGAHRDLPAAPLGEKTISQVPREKIGGCLKILCAALGIAYLKYKKNASPGRAQENRIKDNEPIPLNTMEY